MPGFGTMYNPTSVMMKAPSQAGTPCLSPPTKAIGTPNNSPPATGGPTQTGTLAATANRPTGPSSGYDPAYLQNLVTYGAGQFQQPSGGFNFNPTQISSFPGAPTGGGNAPIAG